MRVIAVDDEFLVLSGLTRAIKKVVASGVEVKGFRIPSEALQYAQEHTVDVAFLNLETAQMHGLILAKKLKNLNPKVNLIFVSATHEYSGEAWNLYASGYLLKPFKKEEVEQEFMNLRYTAANSEQHYLLKEYRRQKWT